MSSNTKQILAITLGSLGIVLGILAMVTAYNAKNAAKENEDVAAQVKEEFTLAQKRQDALESSQVSKAEQLINSLSAGERKLVGRIVGNTRAITKLKRRNRSFRAQLNSLKSRDQQLTNEIAGLESDQNSDVNQLNGRINKTNQNVNRNTQSINNLRNRVNADEIVASP